MIATLFAVKKAVKGFIVMSEKLEKLADSLYNN